MIEINIPSEIYHYWKWSNRTSIPEHFKVIQIYLLLDDKPFTAIRLLSP